MGKKVEKVDSKKVIEYTVTSRRILNNPKKVDMPRIVNQRTVSLATLLKEGEEGRYFTSRPYIFEQEFAGLMKLVKEHLEQGDAVNLGGYMRLQPTLKGHVGFSCELTSKNALSIRITTLSKLKLNLENFAWRLVGGRAKKVVAKKPQ